MNVWDSSCTRPEGNPERIRSQPAFRYENDINTEREREREREMGERERENKEGADGDKDMKRQRDRERKERGGLEYRIRNKVATVV